MVDVLVAELLVNQPVHGGACDFDEAVLDTLKPARGKQGHPELEELLVVEAVDHHVETADEVFEVAVHPLDALEHGGPIDLGVFVDLADFVEGELEIQLRDLVVGDENFLVGKRGHRVLQAEQGVEVDVVPIGGEVRVEQAIEVGGEVLSHGGIFLLKELEPGQHPGVKRIGFGHAGKLRLVSSGSACRLRAVVLQEFNANRPHDQVGLHQHRNPPRIGADVHRQVIVAFPDAPLLNHWREAPTIVRPRGHADLFSTGQPRPNRVDLAVDQCRDFDEVSSGHVFEGQAAGVIEGGHQVLAAIWHGEVVDPAVVLHGSGVLHSVKGDVPLQPVSAFFHTSDEPVRKQSGAVQVGLVVVAHLEDPVKRAGAAAGSHHLPSGPFAIIGPGRNGQLGLARCDETIPNPVLEKLALKRKVMRLFSWTCDLLLALTQEWKEEQEQNGGPHHAQATQGPCLEVLSLVPSGRCT